MRMIRAFFMAFGMFTSIPCPYRPWDESARGLMVLCLPVVGAVLGGIWFALAWAASRLLTPMLCAAVTAALPFLLTGFIHLDGYMDTCDAILSWRPLEDRWRILKDSHTGAFAVIALAILFLVQFAGVSDAAGKDLLPFILIPAVSRCGSGFCLNALHPLGHSEYKDFKPDTKMCVRIALLWAVFTGIGFAAGIRTGCVLLAETAAYALSACCAVRTLKGISGDVCGFALTVSECAALIARALI